jgi:hypothetical protein
MTAHVSQTIGAASTKGRPSGRASELIDNAKRTLRARTGTPMELLAQAKQLKDAGRFDFACRILALARAQRTSDDRQRQLLAQQHALCTYKNPDAPLIDRLDEALGILEEEINLRTFEPLQFRDLFPGIAVTLVDGGVHDNQGILSLLEQNCDNLIISDASGQMGQSDSPGVGPFPVLYRSDSVFQARMRDLQFRDLTSRIRGGVVSATDMHLKQDLDVTAKDWIGCDDPKENPAASSSAVLFTRYDVRKDIQRLLADVRTDLDSFCDAEAHALMTSGYKMTTLNLKDRGLAGSRRETDWGFLYIDHAMRTADARLVRILKQAGSLGFKVWGLIPSLRAIGFTALVIAFIAAAIVGWKTQDTPLPFVKLGGLIFTVLIFALTAVLGPAIGRVLNAPGWLKRALIGVGVGLFGWAVVLVHLQWFDRWYLAYGARSHFPNSAPGADSQ